MDAGVKEFEASGDGHQADREVKGLKAVNDIKQSSILLVQVAVKLNDDRLAIRIPRRDILLNRDQALTLLDKVMGRGLFKVLRTKRALKRGFIVAATCGAYGH